MIRVLSLIDSNPSEDGSSSGTPGSEEVFPDFIELENKEIVF